MRACYRCALPVVKLDRDGLCPLCVHELTVGPIPVIAVAAQFMLEMAMGRHGFKDRKLVTARTLRRWGETAPRESLCEGQLPDLVPAKP